MVISVELFERYQKAKPLRADPDIRKLGRLNGPVITLHGEKLHRQRVDFACVRVLP